MPSDRRPCDPPPDPDSTTLAPNPGPPPTTPADLDSQDHPIPLGDKTAAPSNLIYPPLVQYTQVKESSSAVRKIQLGQCLGDFEILRVLGEGGFAVVYLARQVSLGRQVALKVSANRGNEARTLASLEHDHIVQVFSETIDNDGRRLLCMQYVPGTTLDHIIYKLSKRPFHERTGRAILEIIDTLSTHPAAFDPAALRDRESLAACDPIEAVCWFGVRLAEALAYAHGRGVLHRDVKPANILVNPYGRPLLADFNLAFEPERIRERRDSMFGGTLAYMGPEHLQAFHSDSTTVRDAVDHRSDIYALGVVLFELLTGKLPFAPAPEGHAQSETLRILTAQRLVEAPSPRRLTKQVPGVLDRVVRRCLDPQPVGRYQSAAELGRALDGCRQWQTIDHQVPAAGPLTRACLRHPFVMLAVLTFFPHFLGSLVNISYNSVSIIDHLNPAQETAFSRLVLGYNLIVYPPCLSVLFWLMAPLYRAWVRMQGSGMLDRSPAAAMRRRALQLPYWVIGISCLGWLPGGLVFPLGLDWLAGPVGSSVYSHFLVSFTISGIIALTYSYFGVQFVVLRVLYPRLWSDAYDLRPTSMEELGSLERQLVLFQLLAGLIPLGGAVLMIGGGPDQLTLTFRVLIAALIGLGMAGFGIALFVSNQLRQILITLRGGDRALSRT